jgi:vacuolar-type H+-ATPase catalytic subunit A/Vma1
LEHQKIILMKLARICLVFSLVAVVQSCGPNQKELNAVRRSEVIAVHDEVMPKMGQLKSFEKKALQKAGELAAMDPVNPEKVQQMKDLAVELDHAYEEMFVWMRQYETEDGARTPEEVKSYLEAQMKSVSEVNRLMKAALTKADSLLKDQ